MLVSLELLDSVVTTVKPAVPKKTVLPAYEHIFLDNTESGFCALAGDGEVWIRSEALGAELPSPMLLNAELLQHVINAAHSDLDIVVGRAVVDFSCDGGKWRVPRLPGNEMVSPRPVITVPLLQIHISDLHRAISMASTLVSPSPYQAGIEHLYVDTAEEGGVVVACRTEGMCIHPIKAKVREPFFLTRKMAKLVGTLDEYIEFQGDGSNLKATCATTEITCVQPHGQYPDYKHVHAGMINGHVDGTATVLASDLHDIIRDIEPFSGGMFPCISLQSQDDELVVEAVFGEAGRRARMTTGAWIQGDEFEIKMNPKILRGVLRAMAKEEVVIEFIKERTCIHIKYGDVSAIVMAMNPPE